MLDAFGYLRELNTASVLLRLTLAMFLGGMIGLERGFKGRPAGFRTYLIVCLGAALTMLLSQYNYVMMDTAWAETAALAGVRTDVSRFGAQVINGIGFLGAGTIIVTGRQQVKGLTTAAGLWASACTGLAIGAGFYEGVILAFIMIVLCIMVFPILEDLTVANGRNMNIYVDFESLDDVGKIITRIKEQDVHIYEVDIDHGRGEITRHPSAVFTIRLNRKRSHIQVLTAISELECVYSIEEI